MVADPEKIGLENGQENVVGVSVTMPVKGAVYYYSKGNTNASFYCHALSLFITQKYDDFN